MNWRFTIIDRDGLETVIDEPNGWDACEILVKRDIEKHGLFFDYQGNDFTFFDIAATIIKNEYDTYGVEGNLVLKIELDCTGTPEELYRGKFIFRQYKVSCGDECFVKIPIETTGDIMAFSNRMDQKVNLDTAKAFDETTDLPAYDKLGFNMALPSKAIYLQDYSKATKDVKEVFDGCILEPLNTGQNIAYQQLEFGFDKEVATEIGYYGFSATPQITTAGEVGGDPAVGTGEIWPQEVPDSPTPAIAQINPLVGSSLVLNYARGSQNFGDISNPVKVEYHISGKFELLNTYLGTTIFHLLVSRGTGSPVVAGPAAMSGDFERLHEVVLFNSGIGPSFPGSYFPKGGVLEFNISNSFFYDLQEADRLFCFISFVERKSAVELAAVLGGEKAIRVTVNETSFFKTTNLSRTAPSLAKVYLINEAISRITEAITNNRIKSYSEYFGRTDSQPYAVDTDGCGSLEAITKGLYIRRQENRIPGSPNLFTVSMKDIWDGLNPIHNIGYGFEEDTNRPGYNRLRVEPWKWFYKDLVILSMESVAKVDRRVVESEHYSTWKFGYEKWEAEEFNGLDEFLTKRTYRTALQAVKNEFNQLSKMVASGYAWEITRRKGDLDSKDWRYDNDTFIACIRRFTRAYSLNLTGQFLVSVFVANEEPIGVEIDDIVTVTGSSFNDGNYTISSVVNLGGGDWGIYFREAVTPEAGLSITMALINPGFEIELGNITNALNIIDPDSIYNYRISPIRNALRWLSKILASFKQFTTNNRILFTDGDGNYYATGYQESAFCRWEQSITAENVALDITIADFLEDITPLLCPERVEFDYPMTLRDFKTVMANPYGLIEWTSGCETAKGWIDTVSYKPEDGMAKFVLIPKYKIAPDNGICTRYHISATTNYGVTFNYTDCDGNEVTGYHVSKGIGMDEHICMLGDSMYITHGTANVVEEGPC